MDGGNGSAFYPGAKVTWHVRVPIGLDFVVNRYRISTGSVSLAETLRRLVESHPAIIAEYNRLMVESPQNSSIPGQ